MSEAEIRRALAETAAEIERAAKPSRGRRALQAVAITVGLGMVSACYGAPPPRPPKAAADAVYKLQKPPATAPANPARLAEGMDDK